MVLNALWSMTLHVILNRAEMALCGPILCHDGLVWFYIVLRGPFVFPLIGSNVVLTYLEGPV